MKIYRQSMADMADKTYVPQLGILVNEGGGQTVPDWERRNQTASFFGCRHSGSSFRSRRRQCRHHPPLSNHIGSLYPFFAPVHEGFSRLICPPVCCQSAKRHEMSLNPVTPCLYRTSCISFVVCAVSIFACRLSMGCMIALILSPAFPDPSWGCLFRPTK